MRDRKYLCAKYYIVWCAQIGVTNRVTFGHVCKLRKTVGGVVPRLGVVLRVTERSRRVIFTPWTSKDFENLRFLCSVIYGRSRMRVVRNTDFHLIG